MSPCIILFYFICYPKLILAGRVALSVVLYKLTDDVMEQNLKKTYAKISV